MEGFPRTAEEAKYLAAEGLFPDGCIALTCEDKNIIDRLMPAVLERWKARRERTLKKRERKYQAETKLRVRRGLHVYWLFRYKMDLFYWLKMTLILKLIK